MRVAIAHDFIRHGGAERVLEELHALWPSAPVYTLYAEPNPARADWDIRSTWLQRWLPPSRYRWPLPLYPLLVDRMRVPRDVDLVVTSSVSWMKGLRAPEGVPHLCYIHRPMMFAYERQKDFLAGYPAPLRPLLRVLAARVRAWDQRTASRPTHYLANSRYTADRVAALYGRAAEVVHPPVDVEPFLEAGRRIRPGAHYLTVSRLESYKRVELVVDACARLGAPLKVAGEGPLSRWLRQRSGPSVEFLGYVAQERLPELMAGCRAFLFAAEEDFGIAPVEAAAAGRPVVAYGRGGSLETVEHGVTGLHFPEQTAASLVEVLERFDPRAFDPERCRAHALRFAPAEFRRKVLAAARRLVETGGGTGAGGAGLRPSAAPQ